MIAHCYFRQLLLIKGFDSSKAYLIILQDCRLDEWKANKSPKYRMSLSHLLNCYVTLTFDSGEKSSKCGECLYQEITQSEASQIGELNIDYYFMERLYRFLIAESWRWFRSRCYPAMMVIKLHRLLLRRIILIGNNAFDYDINCLSEINYLNEW